jgi:cold shock protein
VLVFERVKMFSERGFGFITRDDGGADVFLHISEVTKAGLRTLQPGDRVAAIKAKKRGSVVYTTTQNTLMKE